MQNYVVIGLQFTVMLFHITKTLNGNTVVQASAFCSYILSTCKPSPSLTNKCPNYSKHIFEDQHLPKCRAGSRKCGCDLTG